MATLYENKIKTYNLVEEEQTHNALISERYRRLQNAEADQFSSYEENNASEYTVRASVLTPERPSVTETPRTEQVPQVTEYVRARIDSPVFTTDKFNTVKEQETVAQVSTPTPVFMPTYTQAQAPVTETSVALEMQYSLSNMAKMVIAAFVAVVTVMLALICVNTQLIQQKTTRLEFLEQRKAELVTEYAELQREIEIAKSEEAVREYAQSQGMIQMGK